MTYHQSISLRIVATVIVLWGGSGVTFGAPKISTIATPNGGRPMGAKIDGEGTIHLVYETADGPQYVRSTDQGRTFSKAIAVVDRANHDKRLEFSVWDMVVGPQGRVHVAMGTNAWKLKLPQEEWGFFYARLDPGATSFTPVRNINRKPSEGFSLAADDRGNVTACWLSDKLYANISSDNGNTFSPTVEIDPAFNPCNCCTTSATYGADGRLALLYREETDNERDMYLVLWDQAKNNVARRKVSSVSWTIDACPMTYYSVTPDRDGYVAIWPTKGAIYFARLDRDGALRSPAEIKTPGLTGMRTGMITLNARDGGILAAWKKDSELSWQLYDEQGHVVGDVAHVKSPGSGAAGVLTKDGQVLLFR